GSARTRRGSRSAWSRSRSRPRVPAWSCGSRRSHPSDATRRARRSGRGVL
ncbi:hypothetical protein N136_04617, partial [Leifsonia aquatica ATCC 14665]